MSQPRTPTTPSENAAPRRSGRPRLLEATAVGLGALFATALFLGLFDHGLPPEPARADAATPMALAAAGGPAAGDTGLCFHGRGGELLDLAPAGQHCR